MTVAGLVSRCEGEEFHLEFCNPGILYTAITNGTSSSRFTVNFTNVTLSVKFYGTKLNTLHNQTWVDVMGGLPSTTYHKQSVSILLLAMDGQYGPDCHV